MADSSQLPSPKSQRPQQRKSVPQVASVSQAQLSTLALQQQQQQQQALAELQTMLANQSSTSEKHQLPDQYQPVQQKMQPHSESKFQDPTGAHVKSSTLALQQQQQKALAELQTMLANQSSTSEKHQLPDQKQPVQQKMQPHSESKFQDPTGAHVKSSTLALQQQQQKALAELQVVLSQSPRRLLTVPSPRSTLLPKSSDALLHAVPEAQSVGDSHLQRPPSSAGGDDDSDPEFINFLSKLDSS
jgi:hypothetical protein